MIKIDTVVNLMSDHFVFLESFLEDFRVALDQFFILYVIIMMIPVSVSFNYTVLNSADHNHVW